MSDHNMVIRRRVGRVSIYEHHGSWWTYHRNGKKHCRRRIGSNRAMAECEASLLNAELAAAEANLSIREILTRRFESGGVGACPWTGCFQPQGYTALGKTDQRR
jgi:hypothetical protein